MLPESEDAFDGPQATAALAKIYAWVGENDEAIRLLDHLLSVPSGLTVPMIKLDPSWDPLRKDPRFQALIDKYQKQKGVDMNVFFDRRAVDRLIARRPNQA